MRLISIPASRMAGRSLRQDWIPASALWLCWVACGAVGMADEFRWNLAVNDRLDVELKQTLTATSICDSRERVETSDSTVRMKWTVLSVGDEGYTTEQVIESIALRMGTTTADGSGLVDLSTETGKPLTGVPENLRQQLMALRGAKFTVVFSADGTVKSVRPDPATAEKFRDAPATSPLQGMFGESGLQRWFARTQMTLPSGDVAPGHKWQTGQNPAADAPPEPLLNWTYAGKTTRNNRDLRRFTCVNSDTSIDRTVDGELKKLSVSGEFLFDPALGVPASGTVTSRIELVARYRELVIQTNIDTTSTLTLTRN